MPAGEPALALAPAPPAAASRHADEALRWALIGGLAGAIFMLDVAGPPGLAITLAYLPLVILALGLRGEWALIQVGIGCAVLTAAGWLLEAQLADAPPPVANPLLTVCAIGISSALLARRKRAAAEAEALPNDREELANLLHRIDLPIIVSDPDEKVRFWNRDAERRYGYAPHEILAADVGRLSPADTIDEDREAIQRALSGDACSRQTARITKGGTRIEVQTTAIPLKGRSGDPAGVAMIDHDRSPEVKMIHQMRELALYDSLTSLPNRRQFYEQLANSLSLAERKGWILGLLFFDLDGFKKINDSLGHSVGDHLLCLIAERLMSCVRRSDYVGRRASEIPETTISRLGGDEFTVILNEIHDTNIASVTAHRMLEAVSAPIDLGGQEVSVSSSVGIAIYPYDGNDAETLIRNADTAMYHAKDLGPGRCSFYSEEMNHALRRRLDLAGRLRRAVDEERLTLNYQPIFRAEDGYPLGAELLARWSDDDFGPISPAEFVPIAEESGLIDRIGTWVLRSACHFAGAWARTSAQPFSLAVNVSTHQLKLENLVETVKDAMDTAHFAPEQLTLEITESAVMEDGNAASETINELRALGIRVALDDFGTGYSSLSRLRRLGLDSLKIDRSFISAIGEDERSTELVVAIIAMAHALRLHVVAEGVETKKQLNFLRRHKCDSVQGYLLSRPLAANDFERLMQDAGAFHKSRETKSRGQ